MGLGEVWRVGFDPVKAAREAVDAIRREASRRAEIARGRIRSAYNDAVGEIERMYEDSAREFASRLKG